LVSGISAKTNCYETVKSRKTALVVIPAEAGIQYIRYVLDAGSSPA